MGERIPEEVNDMRIEVCHLVRPARKSLEELENGMQSLRFRRDGFPLETFQGFLARVEDLRGAAPK